MLQNIRRTLGPLFLICVCPPTVMLMWYTNTMLNGSLTALFSMFAQQGFLNSLVTIWQPYWLGSPTAWLMIAAFAVFELSLMRLVPGKRFLGPITPKGNIPVYKANGFATYVMTLLTFCVASFAFDLFPATIIYDHLGAIFGALNIASLMVCALLYLKGRFAPSSTDSGTTGNVLFDYYWGTELYPTVLGWNIKQFINCRFGMMSWGIILISYAAKQTELYGLSNSMLISVGLQLLYITKFFLWERDIYARWILCMIARAFIFVGAASCGCRVFIPRRACI